MKFAVIIFFALLMSPAALAWITKNAKVSGFFGNVACGGYANDLLPTAMNCSSANTNMLSDSQYRDIRLINDNREVPVSSAGGFYEFSLSTVNTSAFTQKPNITSIEFDYNGSQNAGGNTSGVHVYLRNFSSGSWSLKN